MQDTTQQPSKGVDTLAVAQKYQDQLIAKRLPGWFARLSSYEFAVMRDALRKQWVSDRQLTAAFDWIQNIDDFARPLLQEALARHGHHDVDALYLRRWYVFDAYEGSYFTGRVPLPDSDYYDVPLLEAALGNFTDEEQRVQPRRNAVVDSVGKKQAGLSALGVARFCRELDLGKQYQDHLDLTLLADTGEHSVTASMAQLLSNSMLADAVLAKVQGVLTGAELQLVIGLCRDNQLGDLQGAPVRVRQLEMFGCVLHRVVVLDVIDTGVIYNATRRVLVYVPGDPDGAWSACDNLEEYARHVLGMRLRKGVYKRFFSRFVRRRDSHSFFTAVSERLDDVAAWATRDLDEKTLASPVSLFHYQAAKWVEQIKDDAAMIAPPVAQLDRQVQAEHDKRLRAEGWTLLALAGLFVPAVGALLTAVLVYDLLQEAYQAIADWHDDERDAAFEHVLHVGKQLGVAAAAGATVALAHRAWSNVDDLISARLENGEEKLWNGDLEPYRSEGPPNAAAMDDEGIVRHGGNSWVNMQGHWYRITRSNADEPWRLLPYQGHSPELRHNGAGAWRLWFEQPAEWDDRPMLFRRLGRPYSELAEHLIDQVMAIHGLTDDHLRALHVYARPAEAGLADTVSRVVLADRIRLLTHQLAGRAQVSDTALLAHARQLEGAVGMDGQALAEVVWGQRRRLLQHAYEVQFPDSEGSALLRRHFTSLHRLAADQLLRMASEEDREALLQTQRVPLFMAQSARSQVMGIRVARVSEALLFDTPQNLDLARVVLHLLARLPGASALPGWRLFDGDAGEPLLTTTGVGAPVELVHRDGLFSLRAAEGAVQPGTGELFDTITQGFSADSRAALGLEEPFAPALRAHLAEDATRQRGSMQAWLGLDGPSNSFLAPLRLDDGRVGYPLSGGRFWATLGGRGPRALQARLRDLYPAFSTQQIGRWLEGDNAQANLEMLEQQYTTLNSHLNQWVRGGLSTFELFARRAFRRGLIDCWRWLVPEMEDGMLPARRYILSQTRSRLQNLPSIPAAVSFPHISMLAIRAMRMETVPENFLAAFPNLRSLEMTNCRLRRLPLSSALAGQLEVLDLSGNQIALDEEQALGLASCQSLVYLNLSSNPLGTSFSVSGMPRLNALHLNNAQLASCPYGILDCQDLHTLDLRDNGISELPADFYGSDLWRDGRVNLHGNLLAAPSDALGTWHLLEQSQVPYHLRWLDVVPASRRDDMAALWTQLEAEQGAGDFFSTMAQLTTSGNFKSPSQARNFAVRLLDMFEYMWKDDALKRELFENALVTDCQDNATVRFSDLELRVMVWRALHSELVRSPERALLHLGGQLWRMETLDQLAAEHALVAGASRESIEFALAYRIALRSQLDLPIQQDDMLYYRIANLSWRDLHRAKSAVIAAQSPGGLAQFMARQTFWQDYLKANFRARLRVPDAYHEQLEWLMEQGNREHDIALLHIDNQQREHEVLLQLTREAMGRAGVTPHNMP
ncbi:hypothetical protein DBADOPDK_02366 [Pseudomonas sp. MM223]|nr:hypothetical protein DBADOPDK_02366 [Pseudomonas sp. MM223]